MKQLAWLLLVVGLTVQAAGLGQLFNTTKPVAPSHPQPQAPKTPAANPVVQQTARPRPQPAVAPKPAATPAPATKPADTRPNNPTTDTNKNCSPTDSTCKR
jgi:hypothetical protein